MMDDTTVQTTPAPRQAREHESIPIPEGFAASLATEGIELTLLHGEREFPESWNDANAWISLHKDGSHCTAACACVGKDALTRIRCGETVAIGHWTWITFKAPWIVGWQRTGPSAAELELEAANDAFEEDLAQENILHDLTREDVAACEADIEALKTRRATIRASLRRWRKEARDAEHRYGIALQMAWAGWSAAIILAAYLIGSVI